MGLFLFKFGAVHINNLNQNLTMADQTERAFQKQPTISYNRKGGLKKAEQRFVVSPGLGFKVPREAREGNYIDKKCPFVGKVSNRGHQEGLPSLREEIQPIRKTPQEHVRTHVSLL